MEPLTGVGHQPPTRGQLGRGVAVIALTQPRQTIGHPGRQWQIRGTIQLGLQKLMEALLTPLYIREALIRLEIEGLLQRAQPGEQLLELLSV